jgi:hypothetical protein
MFALHLSSAQVTRRLVAVNAAEASHIQRRGITGDVAGLLQQKFSSVRRRLLAISHDS